MSEESNNGFVADVLVVAALMANLWLTGRRDHEEASDGVVFGTGGSGPSARHAPGSDQKGVDLHELTEAGVMFSASGRPRRQRIVVFDEACLARWVETLAGCRGHILRELPLLNAVIVLVDEDERWTSASMNTRASVARSRRRHRHPPGCRAPSPAASMHLAAAATIPWGVARLGLDGLPYFSARRHIAVLDTGIDVNHRPANSVQAGFSVIDETAHRRRQRP